MKKWLKERMPVKCLDYEVPSYANTLPFSLGGLTIINILLLAISGFILANFKVAIRKMPIKVCAI